MDLFSGLEVSDSSSAAAGGAPQQQQQQQQQQQEEEEAATAAADGAPAEAEEASAFAFMAGQEEEEGDDGSGEESGFSFLVTSGESAAGEDEGGHAAAAAAAAAADGESGFSFMSGGGSEEAAPQAEDGGLLDMDAAETGLPPHADDAAAAAAVNFPPLAQQQQPAVTEIKLQGTALSATGQAPKKRIKKKKQTAKKVGFAREAAEQEMMQAAAARAGHGQGEAQGQGQGVPDTRAANVQPPSQEQGDAAATAGAAGSAGAGAARTTPGTTAAAANVRATQPQAQTSQQQTQRLPVPGQGTNEEPPEKVKAAYAAAGLPDESKGTPPTAGQNGQANGVSPASRAASTHNSAGTTPPSRVEPAHADRRSPPSSSGQQQQPPQTEANRDKEKEKSKKGKGGIFSFFNRFGSNSDEDAREDEQQQQQQPQQSSQAPSSAAPTSTSATKDTGHSGSGSPSSPASPTDAGSATAEHPSSAATPTDTSAASHAEDSGSTRSGSNRRDNNPAMRSVDASDRSTALPSPRAAAAATTTSAPTASATATATATVTSSSVSEGGHGASTPGKADGPNSEDVRARAESEAEHSELSKLLSQFHELTSTMCESLQTMQRRQLAIRQESAEHVRRQQECQRRLPELEKRQQELADEEEFEAAEALNGEIDSMKKATADSALALEALYREDSDLERQQADTRSRQARLLEHTMEQLAEHRTSEDANLRDLLRRTTTRFTKEEKRIQSEAERVALDRTHLDKEAQVLEEEKEATESQIAAQTGGLAEERTELEGNISQVDAEIEALRAQLRTKEEERQGLADHLATLTAQIDKVREKFKRQLARAAEREKLLLRNRAECEHDESVVAAEREKFEAEQKQAEEACATLSKRIAGIAEELEIAANVQETLRRHEELSRQSATASGAGSGEEVGPEVLELQSALAEAEEQTHNAAVRKAVLDNKVAELVEEVQQITTDLPQLESQKKAAAAARQFKEAGAISKRIKSLTSRCEEAGQELETARQDVGEVDTTLAECRERQDAAATALRDAQRSADVTRLRQLIKRSSYLRDARAAVTAAWEDNEVASTDPYSGDDTVTRQVLHEEATLRHGLVLMLDAALLTVDAESDEIRKKHSIFGSLDEADETDDAEHTGNDADSADNANEEQQATPESSERESAGDRDCDGEQSGDGCNTNADEEDESARAETRARELSDEIATAESQRQKAANLHAAIAETDEKIATAVAEDDYERAAELDEELNTRKCQLEDLGDVPSETDVEAMRAELAALTSSMGASMNGEGAGTSQEADASRTAPSDSVSEDENCGKGDTSAPSDGDEVDDVAAAESISPAAEAEEEAEAATNEVDDSSVPAEAEDEPASANSVPASTDSPPPSTEDGEDGEDDDEGHK